jgi:hypothetical protein
MVFVSHTSPDMQNSACRTFLLCQHAVADGVECRESHYKITKCGVNGVARSLFDCLVFRSYYFR